MSLAGAHNEGDPLEEIIIIESPMVLHSSFLESSADREIVLEYFDSGATWISAPKPMLRDEM